jgi:hypothetical protein
VHDTRGRICITLLSDHGHNLVSSRRIPLSEAIAEFGYQVGNKLNGPMDVVVPEFGVVTCAAIYTHQPQRVAADVVGLEGVEHTTYLDEADRVIVLSPSGRAVISHRSNAYRYQPLEGDPLDLLPIIEQLAAEGKVDADGYIDDQVFFKATVDGAWPDAVYRLWRAFHGLVQYQPDVLVSVQDGWHCGSPGMTRYLQLAAAHGSLNRSSSTGFAATMAGAIPPVLRMQDLRHCLQQLGVPITEPQHQK